MADVVCPVCPFCGGEPLLMVSATQAACGNDDCPCFLWNPHLTREENRRDAAPVKTTHTDLGG